jgi:hypothetical protein
MQMTFLTSCTSNNTLNMRKNNNTCFKLHQFALEGHKIHRHDVLCAATLALAYHAAGKVHMGLKSPAGGACLNDFSPRLHLTTPL